MDTLSLTTFLVVAKKGSFSQAAEDLHMTQPAISKRIHSLEIAMNQKLFDRLPKQVVLTEAGKALLPRAKLILRELDDAHKMMNNFSNSVSGNLPFATSHHIGLHHLPKILKKFRTQYPEVILEAKFLESETAHQALREGYIELAFATLPALPQKEFITQTLWNDTLRIVVAKDSMRSANNLTLKSLSSEGAILPSANTLLHQCVHQLFKKKNIELNIIMETNYLETIKVMVAADLGWSVLPERMIDTNLKVLPFKGVHLQRQLGVIYHKDRTLSNAANRLIASL